MQVEVVVVWADHNAFAKAVNEAIVRLQQAGGMEFQIQYQPLYQPEPNYSGSGGGRRSDIVYTALITYK